MKSILLLLGTGILAYAIEVALVGGFLAFLFQKRKRKFPAFKIISLLVLFFALNEAYYLPALATLDATFTIHNASIAQFLGTGADESLTNFFLSDFFSFLTWFIEAVLAYGFALFLTRAPANNGVQSDD